MNEKLVDFTADWFTKNIAEFLYHVKPNIKKIESPVGLEIGSYEGLSSRWIIENILNGDESKLYCVDTWNGSVEHSNFENLDTLESRFMFNLEDHISSGRCIPIKGMSQDILPKLMADGKKFDFIYVDGSHNACDVISDAIMSYHLLKEGGILCFDDYSWGLKDKRIHEIPHHSIEFFRVMFCANGLLEPLCFNQTAIFKKIYKPS